MAYAFCQFLVAYQLNSLFIFMIFLFNVQLRNKYDDDDDAHQPQSIGYYMGLFVRPHRAKDVRHTSCDLAIAM